MPELPEVETVKRGLEKEIVNRAISSVKVLHPRATRKHLAGKQDFIRQLIGQQITSIERRGKFLWIPFDDRALIIHLGMSGQCLVKVNQERLKHERIRFEFADENFYLLFVDQRTFGGMQIDEMVTDKNGINVPKSVAHIALDPFDSSFDLEITALRLRKRHSEVKRVLLDQTLISGIGNIYADEALWLSKIHPRKPAHLLSKMQAFSLLNSAKKVMQAAIEQGGTSFDSQYLNVNGESGYFSVSLNVYGRSGEPCLRCARPISRVKFMTRSSHLCPSCQRPPRSTN